MRVYLLMRNGIHLCENRRTGPLPPIPNPSFRFMEYAGDGSWWRVLHRSPRAFLIEAEASDEYCAEWLLPMPEALTNTNFVDFLLSVIDAALTRTDAASSALAVDIYSSLGCETDDQLIAAKSDQSIFWTFDNEWPHIQFATIEEELASGLTP